MQKTSPQRVPPCRSFDCNCKYLQYKTTFSAHIVFFFHFLADLFNCGWIHFRSLGGGLGSRIDNCGATPPQLGGGFYYCEPNITVAVPMNARWTYVEANRHTRARAPFFHQKGLM